MKLIIFAFALLFIPISVNAQTAINDDMARNYYQNCIKKEDQRLTKGGQDIFCQCTAHQLKKHMYVEDMVILARQDGLARAALNKIMLAVYAPCMEFPVRDLLYTGCTANGQNVDPRICQCIADRMGEYTAITAQNTLRDILKANPNITDPMAPIINSTAFKNREQSVVLTCANAAAN